MKAHNYLFAMVDGGGNVPPELSAVRRLVERGHIVTVLGEDSVADEIRATGARFRRWVHAPNRPDRRPGNDPTRDWECRYPWQLIDELCDVVVISSAVGLRKPDVAIFELVLERLGVPPAAAIFVDDAVPNVRGARSAGMSAIVHRDAATTHRELVASGLVLSDPAILEGP